MVGNIELITTNKYFDNNKILIFKVLCYPNSKSPNIIIFNNNYNYFFIIIITAINKESITVMITKYDVVFMVYFFSNISVYK